MTENMKTLIFIGAALLIGVVAFFTRPTPPGIDPHEEEGGKLFADFDRPEAVAGIDIVKFDEGAAALSRFKVVELDGEWSIATQENYPADAEDRVKEAATSVMDLDIVSFITDSAAEHVTYGVVEPDGERIKVGATGVGMMVTLLDSKGEHLTRPLIIGKQVEDRDELRYVRRAGQDAVYTVKVSTEKLSTKLDDWINQDLLELTPGDVERLVLDDYAIVTEVDQFGRPLPAINDKAKLIFSYEDFKWRLSKYEQVDKQGKMVPATLADDEEVDSSKLDNMKFALDDLEIAGVERKVKPLADQFRSGRPLSAEKMSDEQAIDLQDRGFFAQPLPEGEIRIFSDAGDVIVGTSEGVEYVLRFGMIDRNSQSTDEQATDGDGNDEASSELSLNRYVLVAARLNATLIDKPELAEVPPEPKTSEPAGKTKPADDKQPPAKDAPKDNKESDGKKGPEGDEAQKGEVGADEAAKEPAQQDAPVDAKASDEKASDENDNDEKTNDAKDVDPAEKPLPEDTAKKPSPEEVAKQEAEARQRIIDDNERKQEDYLDKLKEAEKKVQELNGRFADWYFIVSEDVYKKIRLGRDDVIKKKDAKEETTDQGGDDGFPKFPNFNDPLPGAPRKN